MNALLALTELLGAILQMVLLMIILVIMALGFVVAFPFIVLVALLTQSTKPKPDDWEA